MTDSPPALASLIRTIPDFPTPGIQFRDITTLLADPAGLRRVTAAFTEAFAGEHITKVAAIEARGFLVGAPLALALGAGLVPLRKPGKLPYRTTGVDYALEYGKDRIEMHVDAIAAGERVLLVDDLIATGGTALAAVELLTAAGARLVAAAFVIELPALGGRGRLAAAGVATRSLVTFDGH